LGNTKNTEEKIAIYKIDTPKKILEYYKNWATDNNYEKDLREWNYQAPIFSCQIFFNQDIERKSLILDAGCGSGLVGKILKDKGYDNINGLDFSEDMLKLIPQNIYKKIYKSDLNKKLNFPDNFYDHALCIGTFTYGHVKANAFQEFHRVLKNNSFFLFSINEGVYSSYGFDKAIAKFEANGNWSIISSEKKSYIEKKGIEAYYVLVQIKK
tara:strand:- start:882 stop:1514 length:633 start_codon:yes stop_codon:yes gene_type:complete